MAAVNSADLALRAIGDALKQETKTLVTCHVNPDGDAVGCVIAMHRSLTQLGIDSVMYLSSTEPIAPEWSFLAGLKEIVRGAPPKDFATRTLVVLDCGSAERIGNQELVKAAPRIINIDHHTDNTRFGELNLVIGGASSTAEILFFVLQKMGVKITREIAESLYTGILADSGRFQYSSTSPTTFRVAADLISRGVDHTAVFRHVYESVPLSKTRLFCRMFNNLTLACDGRLAIAVLDKEDFKKTGTGNESTEGLVDNLRAIKGVMVAALIYARLDSGDDQKEREFRVSLRSSSEIVNVQKIAKAKGGGGHTQAAGATIKGESPAQIIKFLIERVDRSLAKAGLTSSSGSN